MKQLEREKYKNTVENAGRYLIRGDERKAPNNRVPEVNFFHISNQGADRLIEKMKHN